MKEDHAIRISKDVEDFVKKYCSSLSKSSIGVIRPVFLPLGKVCAV